MAEIAEWRAAWGPLRMPEGHPAVLAAASNTLFYSEPSSAQYTAWLFLMPDRTVRWGMGLQELRGAVSALDAWERGAHPVGGGHGEPGHPPGHGWSLWHCLPRPDGKGNLPDRVTDLLDGLIRAYERRPRRSRRG